MPKWGAGWSSPLQPVGPFAAGHLPGLQADKAGRPLSLGPVLITPPLPKGVGANSHPLPTVAP